MDLISGKVCFWCGRPAKIQFKNGRYCCEKTYHKCPFYRKKQSEKMFERYKNCLSKKLQKLADSGLEKCKYCGNASKYYLWKISKDEYIFCCGKKARDCPNYNNWLSEQMKQKYIDNPGLVEKQRSVAYDVHNRPEVKRKKSEAMLILHNEDCGRCLEFQKRYKEGKENQKYPDKRKTRIESKVERNKIKKKYNF